MTPPDQPESGPHDLPNIELNVDELRALYEKSTPVVAWYAHSTQVRGPFCRWFEITDVQPEYRKHVADRSDDAAYAAAAMNSVPHLLSALQRAETAHAHILKMMGHYQERAEKAEARIAHMQSRMNAMDDEALKNYSQLTAKLTAAEARVKELVEQRDFTQTRWDDARADRMKLLADYANMLGRAEAAERERDEARDLARMKAECHATNVKHQDEMADTMARLTGERDAAVLLASKLGEEVRDLRGALAEIIEYKGNCSDPECTDAKAVIDGIALEALK